MNYIGLNVSGEANKVLVLPDIHCKFERADKIIKAEAPDLTISLGDLFDHVHPEPRDTPLVARQCAMWLRSKKNNGNFLHLHSNHDLHYAYNENGYTYCSRWTEHKQQAVDEVMRRQDWNSSRFWVFVGDWLLTHAGLHYMHVPLTVKNREACIQFLAAEEKAAYDRLSKNDIHWMYRPGAARGGDGTGGLTWCDANEEFVGLPWLKQVFGHTPQLTAFNRKNLTNRTHAPRWITPNDLCLDTLLKDYAIIENNQLTIKTCTDL